MVFSRVAAICWVVLAGVGVSTTVADASRSGDKHLAATAVLRLGDLPRGWQRYGIRDLVAAGQKVRAGIAKCAGYDAAGRLVAKQPRAVSSFRNHNAYVSSEVVVFPTPEAAHALVAAFRDSSVPICLQQADGALIKQNLGGSSSSTTFYGLRVRQLPFDRLGDESVAYEAVAEFGTGSLHLPLAQYGDDEIVRVGRSVARFIFQDDGKPDPHLTRTVEDTVTSRLADVAQVPSTRPTTTLASSTR
jgi:hypothetical protein